MIKYIYTSNNLIKLDTETGSITNIDITPGWIPFDNSFIAPKTGEYVVMNTVVDVKEGELVAILYNKEVLVIRDQDLIDVFKRYNYKIDKELSTVKEAEPVVKLSEDITESTTTQE